MMKFLMKLIGVKSDEQFLEELVANHAIVEEKLKNCSAQIHEAIEKFNAMPEGPTKALMEAHIENIIRTMNPLREAHAKQALTIGILQTTVGAKKSVTV